MSEADIIKSYLIGLGFQVDQPGLRNFTNGLKDAQSAVERSTSGVVKSMFAWQAAIVGAFTAVGGAAIGMMDKVAQADQEYRLFALRMFTSVDAAKKLKIATDALGASLDDVAWDAELHGRFMKLIEDQTKMQASLGKDFESTMIEIRDVRFEITRLGVELQYIAAGVASSLFRSLGSFNVLDKLRDLNDWIIAHLPQIIDFITKYLLPIFKEWAKIGANVLGLLQDIAVVFINLIGLLSGDTSIQGTQFSFEKLAGAIEHVSHWMSTFVNWIILAERLVLHFINAALLALSGRFSDAAAEFRAGIADITGGSGAILGNVGGSIAGALVGGAEGAAAGSVIPGLGTAAGGIVGGVAGAVGGGVLGGGAGAGIGGFSGWMKQRLFPSTPDSGFRSMFPSSSNATATADQARQLAKQVSASTGIPADVIFAQWAHETGGFRNRGASSLNNLAGIRIPGTNVYRSFSSLSDFAGYYEQMMKGGRYTAAGILQAKTTDEFASALKRGGYFEDSLQNYQRGLRSWEPSFFKGGGGGDVNVGTISVIVKESNASPADIHRSVTQGVKDALDWHTQINLANTSGAFG